MAKKKRGNQGKDEITKSVGSKPEQNKEDAMKRKKQKVGQGSPLMGVAEKKKSHHKPHKKSSIEYLIRFNATKREPQDIAHHPKDFVEKQEYECIRSLLTHDRPVEGVWGAGDPDIWIERQHFLVWCDDGKRHKVGMYCDETGKLKGLLPNHRVNAMIDAGRFTTKGFDCIGKSHNQNIKDEYGCNFLVGDVIIKVDAGKPLPDLSIFGDSPVAFLLREKTPNLDMKKEYGESLAGNMIQSTMKKTPVPSGFYTSLEYHDLIKNRKWIPHDYNYGIEDSSENNEYRALLQSWGVEGSSGSHGSSGSFRRSGGPHITYAIIRG